MTARLRSQVARAWADSLRSRRELPWLLAILAIAAALRIAWVVYAARPPQELHDPTFYFFYAGQIADGNGYRLLDGSATAYFPIGYPATLGAVFALVKHTPIPDNFVLAAGYFQVFLGVATVALAYEVGRRLFGPAVGLLAGLWLALFPNLIYHTATYLSETLFNFLVMAALALLFWRDWRELGGRRLVAFGVLLGLSALVRPISLLFLPLLLVAWLIAGFGWRRSLSYGAAVAGVAAVVLTPWAIRNAVVMRAPIIISANLGDDLCMGHYPGATGHFALPDACFSDKPYAGLGHAELEVRRNNDNARKAIMFAVHHPRVELKLLSRKAFYTWEHDHDGIWAVESYRDDPFLQPRVRAALSQIANIYFFFIISAGGLGLIGLAAPPREPRRVFFLLALLALAGMPLVFFGDARFHVPVMPLLVVPAAWVMVAARAVPRLLTPPSSRPRRASAPVEVADGERPVSEQDALQDA